VTPGRILLIGPGGNIHLQRWAGGLRERGLEVSVLSTTVVPQPLPPALHGVGVLRIAVAEAGMSRLQRVLALLRGWARVPALHAALRPDLVHLHALPAPAAVPFLLRLPRLVVSAWGSDVVQRDARKARAYPILLQRAAAVTATSQYLAGVVRAYLGRPRHIDVVPFGVDVERFRPAAAPAGAQRIGTLRHLERLYGVDVLLDAVPRLAAALPALEVVVGGTGSCRDALVAQMHRLAIERHVRLLGPVAHEQVPELLRTLQLFANPSRAESFGVAALEAQACGVPVVASRVGGLPEVVVDKQTGLLVPPDDPVALGTALHALLADPARRADYAAAARSWVLERYPWQRSLDRMLDVYRGVMGR